MDVTDSTTPPPQLDEANTTHAIKAEDGSITHAIKAEDASMPLVNALTPPTSEEMNNRKEAEDGESDLSDLDMDDDEEIVPDHYWEGGKVPVFKPTMDQFRDFEKFIDKIDKYGMQSGIVKVIPPPEWREQLPNLSELVKTIKIKNPIMQEFMGTYGTYTQANIEKQRSYNLPEWKNLTEEPSHQPPARRGERRRNQEKVVRGGGNLRGRAAVAPPKTDAPAPPAAGKRGRGRPRKNPIITRATDDDASEDTTQVPTTPTSPSRHAANSIEDGIPSKPKPRQRGRPAKNGGQAKSVSSRRMNNITEKSDSIDEAAFVGFDYKMDPEELADFTPERCAELETSYWKSVTFAQPMYAADMPGSLFEDDTPCWNVAKLPNLLDVLGTKVPGVNTAYLYMGMWKATFAWHLEDVDLYSINYIHFGAPKQWYSISQEDARKFEAAMKKIWPNDFKNCDQFLRHKTYLISPELLQKQYGIKVNKLVHYEGEFVITYPYGYHSGYNLGYNCAESVNFATEGWLDYGRIARKCDCEADSVWVDVADIERKLRGEPTPEYYEETDDDDDDQEETGDLPSPPASVVAKPKGRPGKRKRNPKEKDAGKKQKKRIRIRVKGPTREPCILCPNEADYEPLLPTDNGRKAHRSCALFTPETWIGVDNGVEKIFGVTGIERGRLELKCNFCRSKRGACFQCASKKCTRAFHATCALAAGVQIDSGMVPTFGEDGTEYFEEGYDLRCRFHRPKRAKNIDVEALESSKLINSYAKNVKKGHVVQAQYLQGDIFAGLVVENRPHEMTMLVDVLPEGERIELEWKWLAVLDPMDSLRPKPSSTAIPMPEGMNKKSVSIENRQDGIPEAGDMFLDDPAYKWSDFVNLDLAPPGYARGKINNKDQVEIDMDKPDHLFYYLPTQSTEARSRWTDNLKTMVHTTKADFMDRVKPAAAYKKPVPSYGTPYAAPPAPMRQPSSSDRPYQYKPRTPMPPAAQPLQWSVDERSLAAQRHFTDQARRTSQASMTASPYGAHPLRHQVSNASSISSQGSSGLRPFPGDAYYSSRVLPAAIPGQYSTFSEQVRRNSGVTGRRPSFGIMSNGSQSGSPPNLNGHGHNQSMPRPPSVLTNTIGTAPREDVPVTKTLPQLPLPSPSLAASAESYRRQDADWLPPSRLYSSQPDLPRPDGNSFTPQTSKNYAMPRQQPTYQSAEDFQSQIGLQSDRPSAASRYGDYERRIRDMADHKPMPSDATTLAYQSTTTFGGATNGFQIPQQHAQQSQIFDGYNRNGGRPSESPKAPDYSPLSQAPSPARNGGLWGAPPPTLPSVNMGSSAPGEQHNFHTAFVPYPTGVQQQQQQQSAQGAMDVRRRSGEYQHQPQRETSLYPQQHQPQMQQQQQQQQQTQPQQPMQQQIQQQKQQQHYAQEQNYALELQRQQRLGPSQSSAAVGQQHRDSWN